MSFETALTGLAAAQGQLSVLGNNIANASTTGFKQSRAEFADIYAATNLGTSSLSIGQGVRLAAVSQQFTQGNVSFTDNPLDLAISGDGFFRMDNNGSITYSRAGNFRLDRNGFIVNNAGFQLTGFLADATGTITGAQGSLQVSTANIAPQQTGIVQASLNLDASASVPPAAPFNPNLSNTFNNATSLTVYDSLGTSHLATMYYVKTAVPNNWETYLFVDGVQVDGPDTLTFATDGSLSQVNGAAIPPATITTPAFNPGGGAANMTLTMDYTGATQYGAAFAVASLAQDGYTTGRLASIDIDETGVLFARYTNGQSRALGQVALARFANSQGLRQIGDTAWSESFESGPAIIGTPGTSTFGLIQSGAQEESNVEIAEQLVKMITAQRNFQANAQVIQTQDAITQTIIQIR